MIEVREYVPEGRTASLFAEWFLALDSIPALVSSWTMP